MSKKLTSNQRSNICSRLADEFEQAHHDVSREELLSTINLERFGFLCTLTDAELIEIDTENKESERKTK